MAIVHEIVLDRYSPIPARLTLGTNDSYGVERLRLIPGDGWEDLSMVATWHPPGGADPVQILASLDGVVDVPAEATALAGDGLCVIAGLADGVRLLSCSIAYRIMPQAGHEGKEAAEPTPDLVQQVVTAANKAAEIAESVRADADKMTAAETARTEAESARETAETARAAAEAAREKAESARAAAEKSRETAESDRVTAETARQQAEADRKSAEDGRAAAESARQTDETTRQQAETTRKSSESTRESAEADRVKSEKSRASAESNRASAESKRASAESARASAETKRASAETARESAESARETSENHRVSAENHRVTSEQARETAETARVEAEAEREKQLPALKSSVVQLQARQNILVGSETGNPVSCNDAYSAPLCGLTIYGKSTQDGTPTPDAPVPIVSAGDSGSVAVKVTGKNLFYEQEFQEYFINSVSNTVGLATGNVSCVLQVVTGAKYYVTRSKIGDKFRAAVVDKLPTLGNPVTPSSGINADSKRQIEISATSKYMVIQCEDEAAFSELMVSLDSSTAYSPYREQLLTLLTPNGLPGIPVTSGGNYTDPQGQQWVCDEVDLERGVKVQRITTIVFSDNKNFDLRSTGTSTKYRFSIRIDGLKITDLRTADSSAFCSALALGTKDSTWNTPNTFTIGSDRIGSDVQLYVRFENINSLDELQQYLQRSPMSLTAILATPIETPLTPAEIAAYKALTAYAPDTVVQASDGAGVKLEYQRNVNIVIKKFEDAIASMTTT